jgi:integration host factor subunit alpha
MALTKAEIVDRVCDKQNISRIDVSNIVEAAFEVIKASLERGENVKLKNFGNFSVRAKNVRRGRNPKTSEEIVIPAHKVVTFRPSPMMKKRVASIKSD